MRTRVAAAWWWAVALAMLTARAGGDWLDCAPSCRCKWSSGKKSAVCIAAGLRAPPPLSADVQVLDMRNNDLGVLPRDLFAKAGLVNLQRLYLRSCAVRAVHRDAFRDLTILIEIDLADNQLTTIPRDTFRGNDRLRLLTLSGNPLVELVADQFPPLAYLQSIDLQGCHLRSVHSTAFRNLRALESIDLRKNQLRRLNTIAFELPVLKALALDGNPWRCDCRLRAFREWFLSSNLGTEKIFCLEPPSHVNRTWRELLGEDMQCPPELTATTRVVRAEPGGEVSFGCFVRGDPVPSLRWLLEGRPIENITAAAEVSVEETKVPRSDEDDGEEEWGEALWSNVTLANVTATSAGEWTCEAGDKARVSINLVLPRARAATARAAPGLPALLGALGGAMGAIVALGTALACICWRARRRHLPPSRSFTDQEKKLLDASLATSFERSSGDLSSPGDLELTERSPSGCGVPEPLRITIEGCGGSGFPPPPAEFAPRGYGNIFISVRVASGPGPMGPSERYPDLLGGGATLPRRTRTCCPVSIPAYDNMGPRVTAGGSSTWSLPGADGGPAAITLPIVPPAPPPEFVSL